MDDDELAAISGTVVLGSIISVVSVLCLIGSALVLGKWRKSYWRVVLALAVCDLTAAVAFIIGSSPVFFQREYLPTVLCNIQGLLVQFALSGTTYYALAISFMLYLQVARGIEVASNIEVLMHIVWLPPAATLALIPIYSPDGIKYDVTGGWCWVDENPRYARFTQSYIWVWCVMVAIMYFYWRILVHIRREQMVIRHARLTEIATGSVYDQQAESVKRLLLYPLAFIIFWIPATINRSLEANGITVFAVTYLECFFLPLQGITNTIIYVFTSQAHKDIYQAVLRKRHAPDFGDERLSITRIDESTIPRFVAIICRFLLTISVKWKTSIDDPYQMA